MGKVVIAHLDEVAAGGFPDLAGVSGWGQIRTKSLIAGPDRGICLHMHELAPGAEIRWDEPPVDHLVYVWDGEIMFEGAPVETDGAAVVEHRGSGELLASPKGATLAHFHAAESLAGSMRREGGRAHAIGREGIFKGGFATVLADSDCPTCEVWLHRTEETERPQDNRHRHTEDEIIFVRRGGFVLGKRIMPRGTAIAIDTDTIYSFGVAPEGMSQITFRATEPHQVRLNEKNEPLNEPMSMREIMRNRPVAESRS